MYIYFILWVIIQHTIVYVVAQIVAALAIGSCSRVDSCVPLTCPYPFVFLSTSSLPGY